MRKIDGQMHRGWGNEWTASEKLPATHANGRRRWSRLLFSHLLDEFVHVALFGLVLRISVQHELHVAEIETDLLHRLKKKTTRNGRERRRAQGNEEGADTAAEGSEAANSGVVVVHDSDIAV